MSFWYHLQLISKPSKKTNKQNNYLGNHKQRPTDERWLLKTTNLQYPLDKCLKNSIFSRTITLQSRRESNENCTRVQQSKELNCSKFSCSNLLLKTLNLGEGIHIRIRGTFWRLPACPPPKCSPNSHKYKPACRLENAGFNYFLKVKNLRVRGRRIKFATRRKKTRLVTVLL